jgi:hypothetical protein
MFSMSREVLKKNPSERSIVYAAALAYSYEKPNLLCLSLTDDALLVRDFFQTGICHGFFFKIS